MIDGRNVTFVGEGRLSYESLIRPEAEYMEMLRQLVAEGIGETKLPRNITMQTTKNAERRFYVCLRLRREAARPQRIRDWAGVADQAWRSIAAAPILRIEEYHVTEDALHAIASVDVAETGTAEAPGPKRGFLEPLQEEPGSSPYSLLTAALAWYRALCRYMWAQKKPGEAMPEWNDAAILRPLNSRDETEQIRHFILRSMLGKDFDMQEDWDKEDLFDF